MQAALLIIGFAGLMVVLAVLNFKPFVMGARNMFRPPYKHYTIDSKRIKTYLAWVIGLSLTFGIFNLALTLDLSYTIQVTKYEAFFLAVGLISVILYKKDDDSDDKKVERND